MIYLDMDGVIADFFGGIEKQFNVNHWKSLQWKEEVFVKLRYTDFFNTLDTFKDWEIKPDTPIDKSRDIVYNVQKYAKEAGIGWGICSSPMRGDHNNSMYWKRVWLERMGFMPLVENCIFTSNKHKYAMSEIDSRRNILIDDKPSNIDRWEKAGGIGIRFQCNEDDLKEYLFPAIEEAIARR